MSPRWRRTSRLGAESSLWTMLHGVSAQVAPLHT